MPVEAGVQLHLPSYRSLQLGDLTKIADTAASAGFHQVWVTDNLECRSIFVVLAALAMRLPTKLGTAVMVQYFRSPIEAATSLMTISELMPDRELSIALGAGNSNTSRNVVMPRPVGFMRQFADCIARLIKRQEVSGTDFPLLAEYFNFAPTAKLESVIPFAGPIKVYGGGNGPLGLGLAGELMDGVLSGWKTLPNAALGRLAENLAIANRAAEKADRLDDFVRLTEVKVSIAEDHEVARQFVRDNPSCARRTLGLRSQGYDNDDFVGLGIDPADIDRLEECHKIGGPYADYSDLVTDAMIDAAYIAGDPVYCRDRIKDVAALVVEHGFSQVIFSELGPDQVAAVNLLSAEVLPTLFAATSTIPGAGK